MTFLEDRLLRILELRKLGKNDEEVANCLELDKNIVLDYERLIYDKFRKGRINIEEIAKKIGVPSAIVKLYEDYIYQEPAIFREIKIKGEYGYYKYKIKKNKKLLDEMIADGENQTVMADKIGVNHLAIHSYIVESDQYEKWREIRYKKKEKPKKRTNLDKVIENKEVINEFLIEGEKLRDIAYVTEVDYKALLRYVHDNNLYDRWKEVKSSKRSLPRIIGKKGKIAENKDVIERMIDEGKTLREMAAASNATRQAIELYLNYGDRREKWEKNKIRRFSIKDQKIVGTKIVDILVDCMHRKATDEGYGEAVWYYYRRGDSGRRNRRTSKQYERIPLDKLIKFVKTYKEAKNNNTKLTYSDLASISRIKCVSSLERMFDKMNFESLNWSRKERSFYKNREKFIINAAKTLNYLSLRDLGYFLNMDHNIINIATSHKKIKRRNGYQPYAIKYWLVHDGPRIKDVFVLAYRDASQIYGFKDEFKDSREEISEAIGKNVKVVNYALRHRKEIEPKLIKALKTLYPNEKINKPYR